MYYVTVTLYLELRLQIKVENILKGRLDSIPSPSTSVKIQIIHGKVTLQRQNIAGRCQQTFCFQKFAQQCFAFTSQANFPDYNLNFH